MRYLLTCLLFIAMIGMCHAQAATVGFAWDASDSAATAPANNPVKYKVYTCTDALMATCAATDAGTALTVSVPMVAGSYWVYATAYQLLIDTTPTAGIVESPKSNVLAFKITVPPGNPKNFRIRLQ